MKKTAESDFEEVDSLFCQKGLTLVELMLVAAIIGILAMIASSVYESYVERARQSQAKFLLAQMYSVQSTYRIQTGGYTGCLAAIGYSVEAGGMSRLYYSHGFSENVDIAKPTCGPTGDRPCSTYDWSIREKSCAPASGESWVGIVRWEAQTKINPALPIPQLEDTRSDGMNVAGYMSPNAFTVVAIGSISKAREYDVWRLNHQKQLTNTKAPVP